MVNRRISPDLKNCALDLWERGWDRSDICSALGISSASLYRWIQIFNEFDSVVKPPSPLRGRPRMITLAALTAMKEIYNHHPDSYLDELVWFLALHHDVVISKSALHDNLRKAGLTRKLMRKIAQERDEVLRAEYRLVIKNEFSGTGCEFVTVDESSKDERTLTRRYGYAMKGQRAEINAPFVRGQRYSLVAAMSLEGYIAMRVVEGSLDSFEFFDFIIDEVLPQMKPFPDQHSVLVMDNCRIHHSDMLLESCNALGVIVLFLPPYSPDLNPIEESFSTWKMYLRRNAIMIQQAPDPMLALLDACGCITAEMATGWFLHAGYIIIEQ